jgi:DNA-directed RNA polymerase subunit RPC12/RpoP
VYAFYYRCPNCGQIYYSATELSDDKLTCEKCGTKIVPLSPQEVKDLLNRKKEPK